MDVMTACEIAYKCFSQTKGLKGISELFDMDQYWLFWGKGFADNKVQYGNVPIVINKQTGEGNYFPLSDPDNMDMFRKAEKMEVPEKYNA